MEPTTTTTDTEERIEQMVEQAKDEILSDAAHMLAFPVPAITCFADLHDYCDANLYGGITADTEADIVMANEVQRRLDVWITSGQFVRDCATY
jgi:hypothetical protein